MREQGRSSTTRKEEQYKDSQRQRGRQRLSQKKEENRGGEKWNGQRSCKEGEAFPEVRIVKGESIPNREKGNYGEEGKEGKNNFRGERSSTIFPGKGDRLGKLSGNTKKVGVKKRGGVSQAKKHAKGGFEVGKVTGTKNLGATHCGFLPPCPGVC